MKKQILTLFVLFMSAVSPMVAQEDSDSVKLACLNYIEGFYEGNTEKLESCLQKRLYKFGFWKSEKTGTYGKPIFMSYDQAIAYAKRVKEKKNFAKPGAPKKVKILDVMDKIAIAKVRAWWGVDYLTLSKVEGKWMIEQVIWQGPVKE